MISIIIFSFIKAIYNKQFACSESISPANTCIWIGWTEGRADGTEFSYIPFQFSSMGDSNCLSLISLLNINDRWESVSLFASCALVL